MDRAAALQNGKADIATRVLRFFEKISLVSLAMVATLIFAQIVLRNLFSLAYASIDELARFAHINLVFLLVPLLYREGLHVNVDLVTHRVPPRVRRVLGLLSMLLTVLYSAFFLASEIQFMGRNGSVPTPALGMPNWLFFAGAYVGMALLFATACEQFVVELKKRP